MNALLIPLVFGYALLLLLTIIYTVSFLWIFHFSMTIMNKKGDCIWFPLFNLSINLDLDLIFCYTAFEICLIAMHLIETSFCRSSTGHEILEVDYFYCFVFGWFYR